MAKSNLRVQKLKLHDIKKHKVFISYHHELDQSYKDHLVRLNKVHGIFVDRSVHPKNIDDNLPAVRIRKIIRDKYLRDSTVTIVLAGEDTIRRKHVDWEIHASMIDGDGFHRSGILVINLPQKENNRKEFVSAYGDIERQVVYPKFNDTDCCKNLADRKKMFPRMPHRIVDNLFRKNVKISVVPWGRIQNDPIRLKFLIDLAHQNKDNCHYDTGRVLKKNN